MLTRTAMPADPTTGAVPDAATPDLSVVVPSVNGGRTLLECLTALQRNATTGVVLEILVVDRCGDVIRRIVRKCFPEVVVLPVDPQTSIPEMRALAFRHARADAVAVIEDHVLVPRHWSRQLLSGLREGHDVIGGTVDNAASTRTVDWAAFLCEYSHVASAAAGETDTLTGNNVVYPKALLERY